MDIVKSLRTAALALILALLGVTIVPTYAAQGSSDCRRAIASAHGCCKTPTLKACCADRSERSGQSVPAGSRVQVNPQFAPISAFVVDQVPLAAGTDAALNAAPRASPVDLPTLLSTLLL
jgi:hypothetical protein